MKAAKKAKKPKKKDCLEIELIEGMKPQPTELHASRSTPDRVRFYNRTNRGRTVTFTLWPFSEPPTPIMIKKHKRSPCFTIETSQPLGGYSYSVTPALDPGGPPGDPDVTVDP